MAGGRAVRKLLKEREISLEHEEEEEDTETMIANNNNAFQLLNNNKFNANNNKFNAFQLLQEEQEVESTEIVQQVESTEIVESCTDQSMPEPKEVRKETKGSKKRNKKRKNISQNILQKQHQEEDDDELERAIREVEQKFGKIQPTTHQNDKQDEIEEIDNDLLKKLLKIDYKACDWELEMKTQFGSAALKSSTSMSLRMKSKKRYLVARLDA